MKNSTNNIMSNHRPNSSDDEEDEFIAKIKAAAAKKEQISVTSSIQNLIPAILKDDSSAEQKASPSFFAHATQILAKEKLNTNKPTANRRVQVVRIEDRQEDSLDARSERNDVPNGNLEQAGQPARQLESEADTGSTATDDDEEAVDLSDDDGSDTTPNGNDDFIELADSPNPVSNQESSEPEEIIEEEITIRVKVDGKFEKFMVGENQNLEVVFKALAQKFRLSVSDFMILRHGCDTVNPSDTPRKLGLAGVEVLEFERKFIPVVSDATLGSSNALKRKAKDENGITLKFQTGDKKCLVEMVVNKIDTFEIIKSLYVKERGLTGKAAKNIKFQFDGDKISESKTPSDLDMEDEDCVDVI